MIQALIAPIASLATSWLSNKAAEKKAVHEQKISVIKNESNWENLMAESSSNSWKDEYWTIVLSLPFVALFYAVIFDDKIMIERIGLAFELFSSLPDWYQYLLFMAISASFGIRGAKSLMELRKK